MNHIMSFMECANETEQEGRVGEGDGLCHLCVLVHSPVCCNLRSEGRI